MQSSGPSHILRPERSDWLRLRTLVLLRWMAIAGQLTAIGVAHYGFGMLLPLGLCYLAVGAAIIANLIAIYVFPQNKRLAMSEAFVILLFDLMQLSFLLFLTGGLANPFALLILAPVLVSASALELGSTIALGMAAIFFTTLTALFNLPLQQGDGTILRLPPMLEFGFWLSIVIGIAFLGLYARRIATEMHSMSDALLATQMALAREQKLTDLGGVIAAAAHELGTPLATIKLVSTEMIDELTTHPGLRDDAQLILDQTNRCRDILRGMGKAGKDDLHLRQAPLGSVLREAAEPHASRGKLLIFTLNNRPETEIDPKQPQVLRRPELIHGLRNLIQNAVDFARSTVWIDVEWTDSRIGIRIVDDGTGFPQHIIGRIGDPFVRARNLDQSRQSRPGYQGMGLGLFIAITLLERTGAELSFANAADPFLSQKERLDRCGAIVEALWPASALCAAPNGVLGDNVLIV